VYAPWRDPWPQSIEQAFDKIIQQKLSKRKKAKGAKAAMRKKKDEGEDYTPPFLERLKVGLSSPGCQIGLHGTILAVINGTYWLSSTEHSGCIN
jgi:hypothetical protein